jgi:hypothetical protein
MDATAFEKTLRGQGYDVATRSTQKDTWVFRSSRDGVRLGLWLDVGPDGTAYEDRPNYSVVVEAPHGEVIWSKEGQTPDEALELVAELRTLATDYRYQTTHGFDDAMILRDDEDLYIQVANSPMMSKAAFPPKSKTDGSDDDFIENFDCPSPLVAAQIIDAYRARQAALSGPGIY